jgi:hypothetical protein
MTKKPTEKQEPGGGLRGHDKAQEDLRNPTDAGAELPEGLERERKGPLGPKQGRRQE